MIKWIKKHWKALAGGALALVALTLIVLSVVFKQRGLAKAAVKMFEKSHQDRIKTLQQEVYEMEADFEKNAKDIHKRKRKIEKMKEDLSFAYTESGMSLEEQKKRLANLR